MIIIPIGIQCTNATFKKDINKISYTFPFDWMISNPKFVFEMLELLLEKNMDISELVRNHFFLCDKKANFSRIENYYETDQGFSLYNTKYNVIFPHDNYSNDNITKYIRRFKRLKDLILNLDEEIIFIYSSQSSLESGNFTINNINVVTNVYYYLSKIYTLLNNYRNNYKMIVFDSIKNEDKVLLHDNIVLCELDKCNSWQELLSQMHNFKELF
jgi:hypothetical protein